MQHEDDDKRAISRSTFLKGAAGALVGAGALATATRAGVAAADVHGGSAGAPQAIATAKVRDLTGPDLTTQYGMEATDLGIPVKLPDGRLFYVFGDTYEKKGNVGNWRAPVALYMDDTDLNKGPGNVWDGPGSPWSGAVGGNPARQLWAYEHTNGTTLLPADVLLVGNTIYLYAMKNEPFPTVTQTEIWKSDDNGDTWQDTSVRFNDNDERFGSNYQCITWAEGDDGFVYIFSTKFGRAEDSKLYLSRVPTAKLTDVTAYEPWGWDEAGWGWGKRFSPVIDKGGFGELCLRPLDGKWVLTYLAVDGGARIEAIVMGAPTDDLAHATPHLLIEGRNVDWGAEDHATGRVAQPYGGYIIPGSSIGDLHLSVSQWDTKEGDNNWPYRSMHFRTTGVPA